MVETPKSRPEAITYFLEMHQFDGTESGFIAGYIESLERERDELRARVSEFETRQQTNWDRDKRAADAEAEVERLKESSDKFQEAWRGQIQLTNLCLARAEQAEALIPNAFDAARATCSVEQDPDEYGEVFIVRRQTWLDYEQWLKSIERAKLTEEISNNETFKELMKKISEDHKEGLKYLEDK